MIAELTALSCNTALSSFGHCRKITLQQITRLGQFVVVFAKAKAHQVPRSVFLWGGFQS